MAWVIGKRVEEPFVPPVLHKARAVSGSVAMTK